MQLPSKQEAQHNHAIPVGCSVLLNGHQNHEWSLVFNAGPVMGRSFNEKDFMAEAIGERHSRRKSDDEAGTKDS